MYRINVGFFSPSLLGQAGAQAGQQGVEEIEVWLPHFFQSKGPRQLVGSHGATYTPVLGISKEGGACHSCSAPAPSPRTDSLERGQDHSGTLPPA